MKTLFTIIISFLFGALFGNAIQIRQDYSDAYALGWNDAIDYCTDQLEGDDDEID